jgi:rhodanese-related sulfurtransferase
MGNKKVQRQFRAMGRWTVVCLSAVVCAVFVHPSPNGWAETQPTGQTALRLACDPALATSATAAMFGYKEKKIFLVDVRPAPEFGKYHIPGALNIALHAIKAKPFLKTKPIVLVNEGFAITDLAKTCRVLNKAGFRATIMAGGYLAWKQKHGKLVGDPFAQNKINRITPRLLDQEKASACLILIHANDQVDSKTDALMPAAGHLPLLKNKKSIAALKKMIKAKNSDPFARLVIFTSTGKENARIQRQLAKAGIHKAFFLEGGMQAYAQHVKHIQLARRPAKERKMTTGGCKSCPRDN